jgi:hypothetical protein
MSSSKIKASLLFVMLYPIAIPLGSSAGRQTSQQDRYYGQAEQKSLHLFSLEGQE